MQPDRTCEGLLIKGKESDGNRFLRVKTGFYVGKTGFRPFRFFSFCFFCLQLYDCTAGPKHGHRKWPDVRVGRSVWSTMARSKVYDAQKRRGSLKDLE